MALIEKNDSVFSLSVFFLNWYCIHHIRGAYDNFPDFFVQAFKIVSILLLYILWDDWPIFMISRSNEQQHQE